ncbi:MAG: nucleotidyltransferase domain-containing protein [Candidatus Brocadia sp.]|nr:nucleotidyltransferase domain-containing protein [Candidatus Brocadia sp.]
MNTNNIVEKLKVYFEKRDEISFAFLFGSWARGQDGIDSDVDIAIYFVPEGKGYDWEKTAFRSNYEKSIWVDIEKIVEKEVDLLILNRAASTIADSALRGIPIIIKNHTIYMDFLLRITSEAIDFRQWVESYWNLKERIKHGVGT